MDTRSYRKLREVVFLCAGTSLLLLGAVFIVQGRLGGMHLGAVQAAATGIGGTPTISITGDSANPTSAIVGQPITITANFTAASGDTLTATAINDNVGNLWCGTGNTCSSAMWTASPIGTKSYTFTPAAAGSYLFTPSVQSTNYPSWNNYSQSLTVTASAACPNGSGAQNSCTSCNSGYMPQTGGPGYPPTQTFNSSGSFTVPSYSSLTVEVWGGGGAGNSYGAGGGGGGGYTSKTYAPGDLSPGSTVPVTVGAGGSAYLNCSLSTNGGTSSFLSLSATGGTRGQTFSCNRAFGGGAGGFGSGGTTNIAGTTGSAGNGTIGGAGGTGANGGAGGIGGNGVVGSVGTSPAGGGGGGGSALTGGNGASGKVVISITYSSLPTTCVPQCSNGSGSPGSCTSCNSGYVLQGTAPTNSCALVCPANCPGATGAPNCTPNSGYTYNSGTNTCAPPVATISTFSISQSRVRSNIPTSITFSYLITNPPASCTISGPAGFTPLTVTPVDGVTGTQTATVNLSQISKFTFTCGVVTAQTIIGLVPNFQEI